MKLMSLQIYLINDFQQPPGEKVSKIDTKS